MGFDARQIVAGVLTITMFVMLGHMIKRDHFDSLHEMKFPGDDDGRFDNVKVTEKSLATFEEEDEDTGPWKDDTKKLKPCWTKPSLDEAGESKGFITFSLTNGPEYHISQIADAVVVARYLGATLILPDIRGTNPGDKRKFEDVYDVRKFIKSLNGLVRVLEAKPAEVSLHNLAVAKVPNRVTKKYVFEQIEPIFKEKGSISLTTYFPSINMRKTTAKAEEDSIACIGMFGGLELQPEVHEVVDSMIERLRTLSRKSNDQFIAIDLRVDMLEKKGCRGSGSKSCYNAQEIADFLMKIGFDKDTTLYLTQSRWDSKLDSLKEFFPKTYTKESIMPADKKSKFLNSEASEFEKVIDFYICSHSDVFVPAISGLFYANVAGKRIASGKTQILVPADISDSSASAADDFITPYISKRNHMAYSCFC